MRFFPDVFNSLISPSFKDFRNRRVLGLFSILIVCCALVRPLKAEAPPVDKPKVARVVEMKDADSTVTLSTGDIFEIRLPAVPGSGYSWQLLEQKDGAPFRLMEPPTFVEEGSVKPGASEVQVFRLKADKVGSSELELKYVRPWDKDSVPLKKFRVNLSIREQTAKPTS
jgi:predicted secreted protein